MHNLHKKLTAKRMIYIMQDLDDQIANRQTVSEVMHGLQTTKSHRKTLYRITIQIGRIDE